MPVKCQIWQSHTDHKFQSAADFSEDTVSNLMLTLAKLKPVEMIKQPFHRQIDQGRQTGFVYLHPGSLFFQPTAPAFRTFRSATIAGKHHTILYLVFLFIQVFEKKIQDTISCD